MIRLLVHIKIITFLLCPSIVLLGQNTGLSISERLAELKARSNAHENQVAQLLAESPLGRTSFTLPTPAPSDSRSAPLEPTSPSPLFIPPPQYAEPEYHNSEQNQSTDKNKDLDEAYAKLYEPEIPSRLEGYYFGPILGVVFPQDGAIRTHIGGRYTRDTYESDSGYLLGVQVGKDFGSVRVEAEYSYHNFEASTASTSLSANIHNFFSRLILEKELGDRFDLRAGIGMGIGIVGLEDSSEYSGTGFAYDFLFGAAYRLAENWSIQVDYHYYLTAAHDQYDHIKSHLWTVSASLDI
jgi:opacity protein-like surface antigen